MNQGCGGLLNSTSGTFSSPDIDGDGSYDSGLECVWQLVVSPDKVLQLSIPNMVVEYANDCIYDFLEVRYHYVISYCNNFVKK